MPIKPGQSMNKGLSMRAPTPTEQLLNKLGEVSDKILPRHPIKQLLEKLSGAGTGPNTDPSSLINPLTMPSAVAMGILPKQFLKKFAQENAEKAYKHFADDGMPKIAKAASDIISHQPRVGAHLASVGKETRLGSDLRGIYTPIQGGEPGFFDIRAAAPKMLRREALEPSDGIAPITYDLLRNSPDPVSDESIARLIKMNLGDIKINPNIENDPIEAIYRTFRHEMGHAADDVSGRYKGPFYNPDDPRYWVSQPEVRARAIESNSIRDLTGRAAGKKFNRPHFGGNIATSLLSGRDVARRGVRPTQLLEIEEELKKSKDHYQPLLDAIRKRNNSW